MNAKKLGIAMAFVFVLLILALAPTSGQQDAAYDPWMDLNDDGVIDAYDLQALGSIYGTLGTSINKTALLLELQSRVEALEAKFPVTSVNIADYAISNMKLAAQSIPFNATYATNVVSTTSDMDDMPNMTVTINFGRTSHILVIFSCSSAVFGVTLNFVWVQALVDATVANPGGVVLTKSVDWHSNSHNFYLSNVSAGSHTIKIRWGVTAGQTGQVQTRTMTVIALPA